MDESVRYRPKFGFDIRIKPPEPERPKVERLCEWAGCARGGEYRAPKDRDHLHQHSWYCLEHVREFNSRWDFFAGRTDDEVRAFQEAAITGHRPTWRFGTVHAGAAFELKMGQARYRFAGFGDPFGLFRGAGRHQARPARPHISALQAKAFEVFDLEEGAGKAEIRRRYTELVKRFHPDANGGDRGREERLREVINAYHVLKTAGFC